MGLNWSPNSFSTVVGIVHGDDGPILRGLKQTLRVANQLSCPAPSWDATGVYRVVLDADGEPEIQRFEARSKAWSPAALDAPSESPILQLLTELDEPPRCGCGSAGQPSDWQVLEGGRLQCLRCSAIFRLSFSKE